MDPALVHQRNDAPVHRFTGQNPGEPRLAYRSVFARRSHQKMSKFNQRCKYLKAVGLLVEQRGIEPLTSALRTRRSAKLSYCPMPKQNTVSSFEFQVIEIGRSWPGR